MHSADSTTGSCIESAFSISSTALPHSRGSYSPGRPAPAAPLARLHSPIQKSAACTSALPTTLLGALEHASDFASECADTDPQVDVERLKEGLAAYRRSETRMAELVLRLQNQLADRDKRIAELEDASGGLEDWKEREQEYVEELTERDQLYKQDLAERDRQYQEDLEKLRSAISDVRSQQKAQSAEVEAEVQLREKELRKNMEASVLDYDETISTQNSQLQELQTIVEVQAKRISDLESQLKECHVCMSELEAQLVGSQLSQQADSSVLQLQDLAEAQAARIAELENGLSDALNFSGNNLSERQECSDMELRLGKLLELAAARITELEGQRDSSQVESQADLSQMQMHVQELEDVAKQQASRIKQLEAREPAPEQGKQDARLKFLEAAVRDLENNKGFRSLSGNYTQADTLQDSDVSTAAGSGEIPASGNVGCGLLAHEPLVVTTTYSSAVNTLPLQSGFHSPPPPQRSNVSGPAFSCNVAVPRTGRTACSVTRPSTVATTETCPLRPTTREVSPVRHTSMTLPTKEMLAFTTQAPPSVPSYGMSAATTMCQMPLKGATSTRRSYSPVGKPPPSASASNSLHPSAQAEKRTTSAVIPATIMRKKLEGQQSAKSLVGEGQQSTKSLVHL